MVALVFLTRFHSVSRLKWKRFVGPIPIVVPTRGKYQKTLTAIFPVFRKTDGVWFPELALNFVTPTERDSARVVVDPHFHHKPVRGAASVQRLESSLERIRLAAGAAFREQAEKGDWTSYGALIILAMVSPLGLWLPLGRNRPGKLGQKGLLIGDTGGMRHHAPIAIQDRDKTRMPHLARLGFGGIAHPEQSR